MKQALFAYVNHARIRSWNQPVLSNESKVSCSRNKRGPLMGLELMTDKYPSITSQTRYPLRHAASMYVFNNGSHTKDMLSLLLIQTLLKTIQILHSSTNWHDFLDELQWPNTFICISTEEETSPILSNTHTLVLGESQIV